MKRTALDVKHVTAVHSCDTETEEKTRQINKRIIHTQAVSEHLARQEVHPLLQTRPPRIHRTEQDLPRAKRRTLAQLRAQKCPMLQAYLHNINAADSPNCPLCQTQEHTTYHLFNCPQKPTDLTPQDLWLNPVSAAALVDDWQEALALVLDA